MRPFSRTTPFESGHITRSQSLANLKTGPRRLRTRSGSRSNGARSTEAAATFAHDHPWSDVACRASRPEYTRLPGKRHLSAIAQKFVLIVSPRPR